MNSEEKLWLKLSESVLETLKRTYPATPVTNLSAWAVRIADRVVAEIFEQGQP